MKRLVGTFLLGIVAAFAFSSQAMGVEQLQAPELLEPQDGKSFTVKAISEGKLLLKWSAVDDAASYLLQVDGPPTYDPMDENSYNGMFDLTLSGTEYALRNITLEGEFTWRIRAVTAQGEPGAWSPDRQFHVYFSLPTETPAPRYDVNEDGITNYKDLLCFASGEWTKSDPSIICDVNHDGVVEFMDLYVMLSCWATRETLPTPTPTSWLPKPELISPQNESTIYMPIPQGITLRWQAVSGAQGYEVYVDFYSLYQPPFSTYDETAGTEIQWIRLSPGEGYWKVRAVEPGGVPGPWSDTWRFQVSSVKPTATPACEPSEDINDDGAVDSKDVFAFARLWTASSDSPEYENRADLESDGIIDEKDLLKLFQSWPIRETNLPPVTLLWPAEDESISFLQAQNPGLQWEAVPGVQTYRLTVQESENRWHLDKTVQGTSKSIYATLPGEYQWKVQAQNSETLLFGPWSQTRSFRLGIQ